MSTLAFVTTADFEAQVMNFNGVVLVDFYADWCGPCKRLTPELEALALEYAENSQVKIVKLDTEEAPELVEKFQISGIPNVIVFKNGVQVEQMVGLRPRADYKTVIDAQLVA